MAHTYARPRRGVELIRIVKKARMDLPDYAIEATGLVKRYAATKTTPESWP